LGLLTLGAVFARQDVGEFLRWCLKTLLGCYDSLATILAPATYPNFSMKKLLLCILSLALVASFPTSAFAAKGKGKGNKGEKANPAAVLKRFDANSNGVIDEPEAAKMQKAFDKGNPALRKLDRDKDGKLSSGEIFALQKAKKKGKKKVA
jgi:hypothetical protein